MLTKKKLEKAFVSKTQGFFPFNFFQQKFRAKKQNKTVQKNMSRTKVTFLCGVGAFKLSFVSKKLKKFWCVFTFLFLFLMNSSSHHPSDQVEVSIM
jgi:hypothetical protein